MSEVTTPEEWAQWRANPVTHKAFNEIRKERQVYLELMADGTQLNGSDNTFELTRRVSKTVGYVLALDWLLELGKPEKGETEDA